MISNFKKRIINILICSIFVILMLLNTVKAYSLIDINQNVSLTISNNSIANIEIKLYKIAEYSADCKLIMLDVYDKYNLSFNNLTSDGWRQMATTLKGYISKDNIHPELVKSINKNSSNTFNNALKPGLYLVAGEKAVSGNYLITPQEFLVSLPNKIEKNSEWNYNVTAYLKYDKEKIGSPGGSGSSSYTSVIVKKNWIDVGHEEKRPKEIEIQLLCNGKVYDTVILNEECMWKHRWDKLNKTKNWDVVEKTIENYAVSVNREKNNFVITNTYVSPPSTPPGNTPSTPPGNTPSTPPGITTDFPNNPNNPYIPDVPEKNEKPKLPQTGMLWWPVPILIVCGSVFFVVGLIYRKKSK